MTTEPDELPPAEVFRKVQTSAELYRDRRRQWRWRVRASNGRILAISSESYVEQDDALTGLMLTTQPPATLHIEGRPTRHRKPAGTIGVTRPSGAP